MSSSRSRHRSRQLSYYPTEWSNWEWDGDQRDWKRYRLNAPDQYEFEFESQTSTKATVTSVEPRTTQASSESVPEDVYPASPNYVLSSDPTGDITRGLAQKTLGTATSSFPLSNITPAAEIEQTHITTFDPYTDKEVFDHHYKVHKQFEFKQGRVFKVLWSEPQGAAGGRGDGTSNSDTLTERVDKFGEPSFQKVRRFVIISHFPGHCICLPINTYSRQGVTKKGVHAGDHTIAYSGNKAVYFKGERAKGLTKKPIKIVTKNPRHKLDDLSRLNYAKTYTVEYNVKVWFIGNVHQDSMWQFITDYNQVHPPEGTQNWAKPSVFEDETSFVGGGTDDYVATGSTYNSGPSSRSASYMTTQAEWPEEQYFADSYEKPHASYPAAEESYSSGYSKPSYNDDRPTLSRGKGKEIQHHETQEYEPYHPDAAEYDPHLAYEPADANPAATEDYAHEHPEDYTEPGKDV